MSKLADSMEIADEVKAIFDFDDYSAFSHFSIDEDPHDAGEWKVTFKLLDVPLTLHVRKSKSSSNLEFNVYDDNWEQFRSYNHTAAKPVVSLLFDVCARLNRVKKQS